MQVKFLKLSALKLHIVFKFFDFFCVGVWLNFNSFSLKVPIHATCCLHCTKIASKNSWAQFPLKWKDFTTRVTEK